MYEEGPLPSTSSSSSASIASKCVLRKPRGFEWCAARWNSEDWNQRRWRWLAAREYAILFTFCRKLWNEEASGAGWLVFAWQILLRSFSDLMFISIHREQQRWIRRIALVSWTFWYPKRNGWSCCFYDPFSFRSSWRSTGDEMFLRVFTVILECSMNERRGVSG